MILLLFYKPQFEQFLLSHLSLLKDCGSTIDNVKLLSLYLNKEQNLFNLSFNAKTSKINQKRYDFNTHTIHNT